jgi:hypothetical protein
MKGDGLENRVIKAARAIAYENDTMTCPIQDLRPKWQELRVALNAYDRKRKAEVRAQGGK